MEETVETLRSALWKRECGQQRVAKHYETVGKTLDNQLSKYMKVWGRNSDELPTNDGKHSENVLPTKVDRCLLG